MCWSRLPVGFFKLRLRFFQYLLRPRPVPDRVMSILRIHLQHMEDHVFQNGASDMISRADFSSVPKAVVHIFHRLKKPFAIVEAASILRGISGADLLSALSAVNIQS